MVNNIAEGLGGGLYINNADPSLDYTLVSGNISSAGGGVYIRNDCTPIFNHTTIAYNTSGFEGKLKPDFRSANTLSSMSIIRGVFLGSRLLIVVEELRLLKADTIRHL